LQRFPIHAGLSVCIFMQAAYTEKFFQPARARRLRCRSPRHWARREAARPPSPRAPPFAPPSPFPLILPYPPSPLYPPFTLSPIAAPFGRCVCFFIARACVCENQAARPQLGPVCVCMRVRAPARAVIPYAIWYLCLEREGVQREGEEATALPTFPHRA